MKLDGPLAHVYRQIDAAPVLADPFAHLVVESLLPETCFDELMGGFPEPHRFQKAIYPGTGHGRRTRNYRGYGLAFPEIEALPVFAELAAFLSSERFSRLMFDKFSAPLGHRGAPIPIEKRGYFDGAADYSSRFDLHIDLAGYELPPHRDSSNKIVTYQLFLNERELAPEYGTMLCRPKTGNPTARRGVGPGLLGAAIDLAARLAGLRSGRAYRRLEQSPIGLALGVGANHGWMPWGKFETVKVIPAKPNSFMAFAPSEITYHAVRLPDPESGDRFQRRVLRGFIRAGRQSSNWITVVRDGHGS